MKFEEREVQFLNRYKVVKVDENNNPLLGEVEILAYLTKDEGVVTKEGPAITASVLNKGNWRDDNSLSFKIQSDNELPLATATETKIVTLANGQTWLLPPNEIAYPKEIGKTSGTTVKVDEIEQSEVNFIADPQMQINTIKTDIGGVNDKSTMLSHN